MFDNASDFFSSFSALFHHSFKNWIQSKTRTAIDLAGLDPGRAKNAPGFINFQFLIFEIIRLQVWMKH